MAKMITKKDNFETLLNMVKGSVRGDRDNLIKFINHEIELLNKSNSKTKMTAVQQANLVIKENVLEVLEETGRPMTISEMLTSPRLISYSVTVNGVEKIETMTGQKLASVVTQLVKSGAVVRTVEKKKAYFSLPELGE